MKRTLATFSLLFVPVALATTYANVILDSKVDIPSEILKELVALCAPCEFADIGSEWTTSQTSTATQPQRRLTRISTTGEEWTIKYERLLGSVHERTAIFAVKPSPHFVGGSCPSRDSSQCEW